MSFAKATPTAGGLAHGTNGNVVGNAGAGTLATATVLDTTLADNGGPTLTHALVSDSPAIDMGDNALIPPDTANLDGDSDTAEPVPFDQRGTGFDRIAGSTVDAGAFEFTLTEPVLQWATSVLGFSSQYRSGSWSATQTLNAPNVSSYGDHPNAWTASRESGTTEYLTLGYDSSVYADGVMVVENWGNGFVTQLDVQEAGTPTTL